jgi:hypothetical protein
MAFNHSFKIYIPSTVDVNNPVDSSAAVRGCLSFLSGMFGGATAFDASGAWLSSSAGLVLEKITICYAFTNLAGKIRGRRAVLDYAKKVRDDMRQEAVSVEIDGKLYFV